MEIYKILNNNVIVSKNEHDKEIIAMGKGIAFKKKVGEHIEDELIDKVYTLSDEVSSKLVNFCLVSAKQLGVFLFFNADIQA